MSVIESIQEAFAAFIEAAFNVERAHNIAFVINVDEQRQDFGDLNSNAPLALAKRLGKQPRQIAEHIVAHFKNEWIEKLEIAGPGFINATLTVDALRVLAHELHAQGGKFFATTACVSARKYSIEFVSANPTGPLHLGHGRGGIIGDVLGNVLTFVGCQATKEFYINDAGAQMEKIGASLKVRCLQEAGKTAELAADAYHGDYVKDLARQCLAEHGADILDKDERFFSDYAYKHILAHQKETLARYGINFDVWFSERSLHESGAIESTLKVLSDAGHMYEKDGALWFRATTFGDDKDRVVRKSTGEYTYVAADAAYLLNKAQRGFEKLVMVLGHDHHGYAQRLEALRQALSISATLDVILYQLVRMKKDGQNVRMSKRAGNIVTLEGVIDVAGTDVARFFYLNRKADAQLDFDLELALSRTEENPVYYVQYAYVRTNSILHKASAEKAFENIADADSTAVGRHEALLIKKMASLKDVLAGVAGGYQTHALAYYVHELAALFHRYYNQNRVIDVEDVRTSRARLHTIKTLNTTLKLCLTLLGVSCPERM